MKILKNLLKVVVGLILLALIVAIFIDGDMSFEKSVSIDAPIEKVWEHTNTLDGMDSWSPWVHKDPDAKAQKSGTDGTVGAESCWDSQNKEVGKGCQKITKIEAPNLMETAMTFERPNESEAVGYVKLKEANGGTEVTWGFQSEIPYPFRIMKLFMNLDEAIGDDFDWGLNKLKELSEA